MSGKSKAPKSAGGKSAAPKAVGPYVPEPLPPVTPVPIGTNPNSLPFPEWSDQELNAEKWDLPKAKDKPKLKPPPSAKKTPSTTPAEFPAVNNLDEPLQFVDPHLVHLPHSIIVSEWKRPSEVFRDANFIMYKESSEYPDLISGSKHLLHSDFMRSFISAIGILEYLGNTRPSPIEFASPTFFPNTNDEPWRPWHHIYSMCKAGKGQKHNPQVNTLGKYAVRLFWMGCWRKLLIDDLLPIDLTNHILLPNLDKPPPEESPEKPIHSAPSTPTKAPKGKGDKKSETKGSKGGSMAPPKKEIEMWPFLLCKALLKLASLSWTESNEILDFNIIHCLTGWFVQKIEVTGLDIFDIWDMCAGYSDHYTWPDLTQKRPGTASSKGKSDKGSKASKGGKGSKTSKGPAVPNFLDQEDSGVIPYHLVATCTDMRTIAEDEVPDISPCWSHYLLIDQSRDIPLIKPDPLPEINRWQRFRWLAWAIRNGLRPAPELVPIKCFKMVSVFKKCAEHVIYKPPSKEAVDIKKSVAVIEDLALEMGDGKKKGGKDKGKKGSTEKSSKSTKSSKSSKSGKEKGKKGGTTVPLPPDPSVWSDFNKFGPYISCLYIFFKSSRFTTNIKITDIAQAVSGKDAGKAKADKGKKGGKTEVTAPKLLMWNQELFLSRNEPIYMFLDTLDYKLVVINFAQVGNSDILLQKECDEKIPFSVVTPKRNNESCNIFATISESTSSESLLFSNPRVPVANVVIENYDWQSLKIGDMATFLNTYGTKTAIIDVKPGRFVVRMWIKSDTSYSINLMSDAPVIAGTLEVVLENMSHEPERLLKMCDDISSSYGQLVQKFGTPQFAEGLILFCHSYLPACRLSKLQLSKAHDAFVKEFINIIKENCTEDEFKVRVFALRVLFMNPSIRLEQPKEKIQKATTVVFNEANKDDEVCVDNESSEDLQLVKKSERAAATLQAFFKKIFIRKLKALHCQTHKDYLKIFEALKKNYSDIFSIQKRMLIGPTLIRNFLLSNSEMNTLNHYYSLLNDLRLAIYLQHFTGNVFATPHIWLPISRHVFYCNSPNPVVVKICLFCGLHKYMVRVFNNDTNLEIQRLTNNALVSSYSNNALGYTVLCYGWSEIEQDVPWKLDFVTMKHKTASLVIIPQVEIQNYVLKENYRPNVNNTICRCLIQINHDTLATFRLSASYESAKLYFRCLNEVGQVFGAIYGTENVILPAIMLKYIPIIEETTESIASNNKSISSKERKSKSKSRSVSLVRTLTNTSLKKKHIDRMSFEKNSSKGSVISLKKNKSDITSKDSIKYKDTVYILEGLVIDNSWPLTNEEWNGVEIIKARSLLGPPVLSNRDTLGSLPNLSKFKDVFAAKRSTDASIKSADKRKKSSDVKLMDAPLWSLETITNVEDSLVTIVDTRRENEIKDIKRKWYENDPGRYERSKALREAYLESHYIRHESQSIRRTSSELSRGRSILSTSSGQTKRSTTGLVDSGQLIFSRMVLPKLDEVEESVDDEVSVDLLNEKYTSSTSQQQRNIRTLKKPISLTKMLPPLNLENYTLRSIENQQQDQQREIVEEEIEKYVKTFEDEENLKLKRAQAIDDFEMDQILFEEDMQKLLADQIARNKILDIFFKGCRGESKEMMQEAYLLREKVIDMIIEAENSKPQPTPQAKDKGKGKGKDKAKKGKKK